MKNLGKKVFTMGWLILALGACQLDTINPDPIAEMDLRGGELFYKGFTIDMQVKGPDCVVDPSGVDVEREIPINENYLPCVGPTEITGIGNGTSANEPFAIKTEFTFDPRSCECGGALRIDYMANDYVYVFEIEGIGHMDGTIMTSRGIRFPVYMVSATGPVGEGEFDGYMYIESPDLFATGQDEMVATNAYISGVFSQKE